MKLALTSLLVVSAVSIISGQARQAEFVDLTGAETFGPEDAPATLMIFADLSAVESGGLNVILHGLKERYPATLRVCFRHFPASDQRGHAVAHLAALAAGEQGKFWEMLDLLIANPSQREREQFRAMAAQLELDTSRFWDQIDNPYARERLTTDRAQGVSLNVAASPTYFVNGVRLAGRKSLTELMAAIETALGHQ